MKPEIPSPNLDIEQLAVKYSQGAERKTVQKSVEPAIDSGAEKFEQKSEINTIISDVKGTIYNDNTLITQNNVAVNTSFDPNPPVANDDDVIEKEWVDRAKKIVKETRNDPYEQEKAVGELQVDYVKKRYGRKLNVAE